MRRRPNHGAPDPELQTALVHYLREWLPASARETYRQMMLEDPENWSRHPHFAGGLIVRHALRGNGIMDSDLGVDLDAIWPDLLRLAVLAPPEEEPG